MKTRISFLLIVLTTQLFSQELSKREFAKAFQDADIVFEYGQDFARAASMYEALLKTSPENANLSAKLGMCYLNMDGKKEDALRLLQKASANKAGTEKDYEPYGEKAPADTYMYLAAALQQNERYQDAIIAYSDARRRLDSDQEMQREYIDNQIRGCKYAIELKKKPLIMITGLFAPWLNEYAGASNPALARNDSVFVFTVRREGRNRIMCSFRSGTWQKPYDITNQLGGYDRLFSNSITGDGKTLILFMDDGEDGNLYFSQRTDTSWTRIKRLGGEVKSIYWETSGFITPDGKNIYFASNRPGGQGGLDIWVAEKTPDGSWANASNLGNVINTPYDEDMPFFDQANNALIFSSKGHIGMGGFDVFRSVKRGNEWSDPIGMPYSFNNSADNTYYTLNNNAPGFVASYWDDKTSERNIYTVVAEDPAEQIINAHGTVGLQDGMTITPSGMKILLIDLNKGGTPKNVVMKDASSYEFSVKPGDYRVTLSYEGYKTDTINLNVPLFYTGNFIALNSTLLPVVVTSGEFLSINNIFFEFNSSLLDDQAKTNLQTLKSVLNKQPELKVEVAGYTDNIGSTEYNLALADKRAQAAIDYLTSSGINAARLIKKAYGKSGFIAMNTNRDGSDNPEGRKINRRVTFGILDPKTGVTLSREAYTPKHLGNSYSFKYSIVLWKGNDTPPVSKFNNLKITGLSAIKTITVAGTKLYVIGVFNSKYDAATYLDYAKSAGFPDAYMVNHLEVNNESESLISADTQSRQVPAKEVYTVQIKALRTRINPNDLKNMEGVSETSSKDGFWRYYVGQYNTYAKAKAAAEDLKQKGYTDAFVRDLKELVNQ